ncbi:MAG: hypothetical protein V1674_05410 [Candidatus Omnitrophota bacterium]
MFNHQARWDRPMPYDQAGSLNEKICVLALFKNGKIYPKVFYWKSKPYRIKNITYSWQVRLGEDIVSYFSVDAESGLYEISFSSRNFSWGLNKINL